MTALWDKAPQAAADARMLYANGSYDSACNRAYYAMFNAARALLALEGLAPDAAKRHATVLQQFSLRFVKDGPFAERDGRALAEASRVRNLADYSDTEAGTSATHDVMASLEGFMATAEHVMQNREGGPR